MNKLDNKQTFTYVIAFCLLILVAAYFLVYKKYEDKAAALKQANADLRARIENLQEYYENEAVYRKDTEVMTATIREILSGYAADARPEDGIMEAVAMAGFSDIKYTSIAFAEPEKLKEIPAEVVQAAEIEEYQEAITFYRRNVTYSNDFSYNGLKGALGVALNGDYDLEINQLSYSANTQDKNLGGVMVLGFYSATGTGNEYHAPDITPYISGTSNLFGF